MGTTAGIFLQVGVALAATPSSGSEEYSFNWLDPDKKIYVLQNRKFTKTNHALLSVMVGPGLSNSYRNTLSIDPRLAFYLNETWGLEFFYQKVSNGNNNTFENLLDASSSTSALPVVREIRSQVGGLLHYVPWYAKINVFNNILYFDWYFSAGAGQIQSALDIRGNKTQAANFVDENLFAIYAGTGHQFHLSQMFVFRMDFTGAFYSAPSAGSSGTNTWFSNYTFGLGLGLKL